MSKFAYSMDDESFSGPFDTEEEAIEEARGNVESDGDPIFVGEVTEYVAKDFVSPHAILEQVQDSAWDECEKSEGWLDGVMKDTDKMMELKSVVGAWIEKNAPVKFFSVTKVRELQ